MLDKITITPCSNEDIVSASPGEATHFAVIDVAPRSDALRPVRPFLHRGDWMEDGQGDRCTVLSAFLHEGGVSNFDPPHLWYRYEVAYGLHYT